MEFNSDEKHLIKSLINMLAQELGRKINSTKVQAIKNETYTELLKLKALQDKLDGGGW